ncbi:MAG: small-conductance mechanosensitive channel [Algoriphagus sp.]
MNSINSILDFKFFEYKDYQFDVAHFLLIIVVLLITRFLLFTVKTIIKRFVASEQLDVRNSQSFFLLFKYLIYVITIVIMLEIIGVKITILLAGSAALLVGIGLGLQQIFSDIISGIFLLVDGSVKIGDIMEVDTLVGKVTQINLRTSEILTRDGISIIVPNHKFITENVINWSHNAALTRFDVNVGVAYGTNPEKVREVLLQCAQEIKEISKSKNNVPSVRLTNFGGSSLDFQLLFWSKNVFLIENTKSDLRFIIANKFMENDIQIPFPQRDIHIKSGTLN